MVLSQFPARVLGRYQRDTARFLSRRPLGVGRAGPIVSFTFDDFPRSALQAGGTILKGFGAVGTYYTSFGLMATHAPTGEIFLRADIDTLLEQGHELGCHTFAHCHSWDTSTTDFERSVVENRAALDRIHPGHTFRTFSYPISPPRPATKRRIARYFECCRGGGQTLNPDVADLNYVSSFFIEQSRDEPERMRTLIDLNRQDRGWLVFSTHDISDTPTPYGCTPDLFERVVGWAADSGARILPVAGALAALRDSSAAAHP